jgi:hypothetical protein
MTNDESVRTIIIEPFLRIYVQVATDTTTVYQQGAVRLNFALNMLEKFTYTLNKQQSINQNVNLIFSINYFKENLC